MTTGIHLQSLDPILFLEVLNFKTCKVKNLKTLLLDMNLHATDGDIGTGDVG